MKKSILIWFFIIVFLILFIIQDLTWGRHYDISKDLEISLPLSVEIDYQDTHGGFLNDGETLATIILTQKQTDKIIKTINKNPHWKQCPLTDKLEHRVTVASNAFYMVIPKITNGYWIFKDHHSKATDIYNELDLFSQNRASSNFSVGILDLDTNTLYFYRLDT